MMYWRHPASAGMLNGELYWETACMPIDHEVVEMLRVHKALSCKVLVVGRQDKLSGCRGTSVPPQGLD